MINEDKLVKCGKTGILNPFMYFVVQINMSYKMEISEGFSANFSLWKEIVCHNFKLLLPFSDDSSWKNHIGKSEYQRAQVQTQTISSTGSNLLRNVGINGKNSIIIANTRVKTGFLQTYPRRKTY